MTELARFVQALAVRLDVNSNVILVCGAGGSSNVNLTPSTKLFIAVAGNIGTGKTTLTQMLSQRFLWEPHFEAVVDNPYLKDFYADMSRWSFPLQIFFLNNRFKAHQAVTQGERSSIQDRSIYEDANIFARNLYESGQMEERDYRNYLDLYRAMTQFLEPPHLVIYLRKSLPKLREQISRRGRDYERGIPDEYLLNLNRYYDDWMDRYDLSKKLVIESDVLDFVSSPEDFESIAQRIISTLDQQDFFLPGQRETTKASLGEARYEQELLMLQRPRGSTAQVS